MRKYVIGIAVVAALGANVCFLIWLSSRSVTEWSQKTVPAMDAGEDEALSGELLARVAPELAARISRDRAAVEQESPEESLSNLGRVGMFYWPGPRETGGGMVGQSYIPLSPQIGGADVEAILSNRRFRRILEWLRSVDPVRAAEIVNSGLETALPEYLRVYASERTKNADGYRVDALSGSKMIVGPVFAVDNVPDEQVVIRGARLEILSLVWVAGLLNLSDSAEHVIRVARLAREQRDTLYDDEAVHDFYKSEMLRMASLYNRQILATGLIGVLPQEDAATSVDSIGAGWEEREMTSYRATVTEFDLPVRSGVIDADYSMPGSQVQWVSPLSDRQFDELCEKIGIGE